MPSDKELFDALSWKIANEDWESEAKAEKIRALARWYDKHQFFTPLQVNFIKALL